MSVMVRVPTPLRRLTSGQDKVTVEGRTLGEVIDSLETLVHGLPMRNRANHGNSRDVGRQKPIE